MTWPACCDDALDQLQRENAAAGMLAHAGQGRGNDPEGGCMPPTRYLRREDEASSINGDGWMSGVRLEQRSVVSHCSGSGWRPRGRVCRCLRSVLDSPLAPTVQRLDVSCRPVWSRKWRRGATTTKRLFMPRYVSCFGGWQAEDGIDGCVGWLRKTAAELPRLPMNGAWKAGSLEEAEWGKSGGGR